MRRLCLLRRDLPLLSLVSELPGLLVILLLRASQLSSPAQKRVMSVVRAAMDSAFHVQGAGQAIVTDVMFEGCKGLCVRTVDYLIFLG